MSSYNVDSLQTQITVIPEAYDNDIGKGLFIKPSTVDGRTSIIDYVLSANDESGKVYWKDASVVSLPAAIQSIADLTTNGNELLYTTGTNVYATTPVAPTGRSFLALTTPAEQRAQLGLEIGVNVQDHSSVLDNLVSAALASVDDRLVYTSGNTYATSSLTPYARTNIINATDAGALAASLGYVLGPVSTVNAMVKVSDTNTVTGTGISIDADNNITDVNDLTIIRNFSSTGTVNGVTTTEFTQLANIDTTSISSLQWGYLGSLDQALATTDTPTFNGLSASGQRITNIGTPTTATDATTKAYVDAAAATGASPLETVAVATIVVLPGSPGYATPAETLTSTTSPGGLVIDGVTAGVGDRILVKNQSNNQQNGIYTVTDDGATPGPEWVLTRSSDFNQAAMPLLSGSSVFVVIGGGTTTQGTTWALQSTINNVDPLTDAVVWIQIGGINTFSAGDGIDSAALTGGVIQTDSTARFSYPGGLLELNTVTVPYGGTGVTTIPTGTVMIGQGTSAVDTSKAAPTGVFVGTTDTQTLTNKTITSQTNNVVARGLFTDSGSNVVSTYVASNPTAGQVLQATSATTATWQTPSTSSYAPDRTLFVYQSAGNVSPNWDNVTDAIADAVTLTPTEANPMLIIIYPGTYSESNPMNIPAYVTISGEVSTQGNVIIRPTAPANVGAIFNVTGNARMYGIICEGFDGGAAYATYGISSTGSGSALDYFDSVTCRNCSIAAFRVIGDGTKYSKILIAKNCSALVTQAFPFSMISGYECEAGGILSGTGLNASGFLSGGGFLTKALYVHDDFSYADISIFSVSSSTRGIDVGSGVTSNIQAFYPFARIINCTLGFISGTAVYANIKSSLSLINLTIDDDTSIFPNQLHLEIINPSLPADPNRITSNGLILRSDLVNYLGGAATTNPPELEGSFLGLIPDEIQTTFVGTLSVGTPTRGYEFIAGEGNSHRFGLQAFVDDGGVFTDVTASIKNAPINPFQCGLASTTTINLASAPATIDGVAPSSGVTRVLVKNGSTANVGTDSVDNGIYVWNGTGNAMTRATDFAVGLYLNTTIFFSIDLGAVNNGSRWKIDPTTVSGGVLTVATTSFGVIAYSTKIFPQVPVNNDAFYIGSNIPLLFPGVKISCSVPITVSSGTSTSAYVWEFWNGSAWTTLSLFSTLSDAPYTSYTNQTFSCDVAISSYQLKSYQYRFGSSLTWATTAVNGVTGYWVRVRVIDASIITQVPVITAIKLHTNRTEINKDGYIEYFGKARPRNKISLGQSSFTQTDFGDPRNRNLTGASSGGVTITQDLLNNRYTATEDLAMSYSTRLPYEMDTSYVIKLKATYSQNAVGSGNVAFRVDYTFLNDNSILGLSGTPNSTLYTTGTLLSAVGGLAGQQKTIDIYLDLTTFEPSTDILMFQIIRLGLDASDTYSSDIYMYNYEINFVSWSNGQYNSE